MTSNERGCPFCGGHNLGIGRGTEDREGYPTYVYCADCGAQGPWKYTRDKAWWTCTAVALECTGWNQRATPATPQRSATICKGCGYDDDNCQCWREDGA